MHFNRNVSPWDAYSRSARDLSKNNKSRACQKWQIKTLFYPRHWVVKHGLLRKKENLWIPHAKPYFAFNFGTFEKSKEERYGRRVWIMKVDCKQKTWGGRGVKDQRIEFNLKVRYREWWNNRINKVYRYGTLFSKRGRERLTNWSRWK